MRSFIHKAGAFRDRVMRDAMLEFGSDAYAVWFILCELVAERGKVVRGGRVRAELEASPEVFTDATLMSEDRLERLLEHFARNGVGDFLYSFHKHCGRWVIKLPNLLVNRVDAEYRKQLWARKTASKKGVCLHGGKVPAHVPIYTEGREGGVGGEKGTAPPPGGSPGNTPYALAQDFAFCSAPHRRTIERNLKDLLRRGVSPVEIRHAAARGRESGHGFFEIVRELEKGNRSGKERHAQRSLHIQGRKHALPEGYFDDGVRRQIEEREQRERAAAGDGSEPS